MPFSVMVSARGTSLEHTGAEVAAERPSTCSICFVSIVGTPATGGGASAEWRGAHGDLAQRAGQPDGVAVSFVVHVHHVR